MKNKETPPAAGRIAPAHASAHAKTGDKTQAGAATPKDDSANVPAGARVPETANVVAKPETLGGAASQTGSKVAGPTPGKAPDKNAPKPAAANPPDAPATGNATTSDVDLTKSSAAPTPVVSGSDRIAATTNAGKASNPASATPASPAPSGPEVAQADAATQPYRPAQPTSDWRADSGTATPGKQSTLRPLLLGAAGGVVAAILVVGLFRPGAPPAPVQNDGKVATALEELERERSDNSARNSASQKNTDDLAARLAALEQKTAAGAAPTADAFSDRLKALEQKIAGLDTPSPGTHATGAAAQTATLAELSGRIANLEHRLNSTSAPRAIDPTVPAPSAPTPDGRRAAPYQETPPAAYLPDAVRQDLRPPGLIPEPLRTPPNVPVRGWVLHSASGGVAVLESRTSGVVEARRGQNVPGLGRIISIERRGGLLVVGTDRGVITAPAY